MQYNSKAVMPPLILRCKSVVSPFQVRFKSVPKNGTYMGGTRELHRTYLGAALFLGESKNTGFAL